MLLFTLFGVILREEILEIINYQCLAQFYLGDLKTLTPGLWTSYGPGP